MDVISQVIEEQREYFKCHRDGDYLSLIHI